MPRSSQKRQPVVSKATVIRIVVNVERLPPMSVFSLNLGIVFYTFIKLLNCCILTDEYELLSKEYGDKEYGHSCIAATYVCNGTSTNR